MIVVGRGLAFRSHGSARSSVTFLVAALARGHDPALQQLYTRHAGAVYASARAVSADHDLAGAVVADVFRDLSRSADGLERSDAPLRPWLVAQAHRRPGEGLLRSHQHRRRSACDALRALEALGADERDAIEIARLPGHL